MFVDEFQEAQLGDRKGLLIGLQHFDGAPDATPVAIIAAGLPSLPRSGDRGGHIGRAFAVRRARPSQRGDCRRGDPGTAEHHHVTWADETIFAAIELAAGYPHKVQLIGDAAWEVARPTPGSTIAIGHAWLAEEDIEDRMTGLFRTRLARYSSGSAWLVEYALHI